MKFQETLEVAGWQVGYLENIHQYRRCVIISTIAFTGGALKHFESSDWGFKSYLYISLGQNG